MNTAQHQPSIAILWDESYLWGLLVWRAVEALGLPYELVKGQEIAHRLLSCKPPSMLIVPGGTARHKASALGEKGMEAIRQYVRQGGNYIGFCGGAGLGLSGEHGLGLCPWTRASITDRMQHFVSGHIHVSVKNEHFLVPEHIKKAQSGQNIQEKPCPDNILATVSDAVNGPLPIWWPGRFASQESNNVHILARYTTPSTTCNKDFWVADLPLNSIPQGTFDAWAALYNIHLRPTFLEGQPCIVHGEYGHGTYTLSYSHLETPNSPSANAWLVHLIEQLTAQNSAPIKAKSLAVPEWNLDALPTLWPEQYDDIRHARHLINDIMRIGMEHSLLFRRNAWLIGWRTGIPGGSLNNLHAAMVSVASTMPNDAAYAYWKKHRAQFLHDLDIFHKGVTGYLLAERLAMTLAKSLPDMISLHSLKEQKEALFGPPMASGGLYFGLLKTLDALLYTQLAKIEPF